jgi:V8-like Glu-specific endopeptidase
MGEFMLLRLFTLLLLTSFSISCNKVKPCSDEVVSKKQQLEESFKKLHGANVSDSEVEAFKDELNEYLNSVEDKKCKIGDAEYNAHPQVRELLAEFVTNSSFSIKVVYGDDNRVEAGTHPNPLYNQLASSVAAQIPVSAVGNGGQLLGNTLGDDFNLCSSERFRDQLSVANCSGFLVDDDLLVTAGHCVESNLDCDYNFWVFDYVEGSTAVTSGNVYQCDEVVSQALDEETGMDYAVVRLNRKVVGRSPLKFRLGDKVANSQSLVVIGHPSGLPQKIADDANVRDNSNAVFFSANLDTFGGNSGSPVFNTENGYVEGILVRGDVDYRQVEQNGNQCTVVNVCTQDGCDGEDVTRITAINGLPDFKVLGQSDTYKALFNKINSTSSSESYIVKLNARRTFDTVIAGRKFLDACVAHVYQRDTANEWLEQVEFNCEDSEQLQPVYDKYVEVAL